jgi:phosphoribosylamine---glycine ligase
MNVGIIGSGGREHAICASVKRSNYVKKIYCFPGNAGTSEIADNIEIDINNFNKIKDLVLSKNIDLLIVGPEKPLVEGIVDFFQDTKVKIFGPNQAASQLEGSKIFTKKLCQKYNIPTANFGIFENSVESKKFLETSSYPIVIKADGLASGKGVYISESKKDAFKAIDEIFAGKFGKAKNLLIEEFLAGEEMSYFIVTDGKSIKSFNTAQDHKRVLEGDKGKNTGGMGAYSPSRLINKDLEKKIIDRILKPTLRGLKEMNIEYKGFLYAGLMIKNNDPFLIEYNVRMGDPECQTILPRLKNDLTDILLACCENKLDKAKIEWDKNKSMCVVLCSKGYPDKYNRNILIKNIKNIDTNQNNFCFHAGTNLVNNEIFAIGGRVLNFVSLSYNFLDARKKIVNNLNILNWNEGFYRKDIGYKVID